MSYNTSSHGARERIPTFIYSSEPVSGKTEKTKGSKIKSSSNHFGKSIQLGKDETKRQSISTLKDSSLYVPEKEKRQSLTGSIGKSIKRFSKNLVQKKYDSEILEMRYLSKSKDNVEIKEMTPEEEKKVANDTKILNIIGEIYTTEANYLQELQDGKQFITALLKNNDLNNETKESLSILLVQISEAVEHSSNFIMDLPQNVEDKPKNSDELSHLCDVSVNRLKMALDNPNFLNNIRYIAENAFDCSERSRVILADNKNNPQLKDVFLNKDKKNISINHYGNLMAQRNPRYAGLLGELAKKNVDCQNAIEQTKNVSSDVDVRETVKKTKKAISENPIDISKLVRAYKIESVTSKLAADGQLANDPKFVTSATKFAESFARKGSSYNLCKAYVYNNPVKVKEMVLERYNETKSFLEFVKELPNISPKTRNAIEITLAKINPHTKDLTKEYNDDIASKGHTYESASEVVHSFVKNKTAYKDCAKYIQASNNLEERKQRFEKVEKLLTEASNLEDISPQEKVAVKQLLSIFKRIKIKYKE